MLLQQIPHEIQRKLISPCSVRRIQIADCRLTAIASTGRWRLQASDWAVDCRIRVAKEHRKIAALAGHRKRTAAAASGNGPQLQAFEETLVYLDRRGFGPAMRPKISDARPNQPD